MAMKYAPLLSLVMATPALAHGWPSICPDCAAEVCRARAEARLGCAELPAVMEDQYLSFTQQYLMVYNRGGVVQPALPQAVVIPARPRPMNTEALPTTPRAGATAPQGAATPSRGD